MGNECAQEFGIEDAQITLEESIAGLVKVVSMDLKTSSSFEPIGSLLLYSFRLKTVQGRPLEGSLHFGMELSGCGEVAEL